MGSNYDRGYSKFGGTGASTPQDDKTVDVGSETTAGNGENTTIHPNYLNDGDSAGVNSGLTEKAEFNASTEVGPTYNYAEDPMTANRLERPNPYDQDKTVSGKGKSFMIDR
jgi:hypothetical protein